jgi:hypothetical protein
LSSADASLNRTTRGRILRTGIVNTLGRPLICTACGRAGDEAADIRKMTRFTTSLLSAANIVPHPGTHATFSGNADIPEEGAAEVRGKIA